MLNGLEYFLVGANRVMDNVVVSAIILDPFGNTAGIADQTADAKPRLFFILGSRSSQSWLTVTGLSGYVGFVDLYTGFRRRAIRRLV